MCKKQKSKDAIVNNPVEKSAIVVQPPTQPSTSCLICNDPHRDQDCPKCEQITALVVEDD